MTKMMGMVIGAVDQFMPGYKTYAIGLAAIAMMVCQMLGYHTFEPEAWGLVGISGMGTWKMGQDRIP